MVPQWIIEKKRDGETLTYEDISTFINGFVSGDIPDYQVSALAMAIFFRGMNAEETVALTDVMMHSGDVVDTSSIDRPRIDKHSTGGIGDKVSLILAPLAAACGLADPMISGRGLGVTGGTLDKLESIPGYRTDINEQEFIAIVRKCGCSIIGQTARIAPADRRLYALRDVTGTVPSIPLIVSSILSKKLSAGIDGLVMDVKFGRGAFMKSTEQAEQLAQALVQTGAKMGRPVVSLITDMNQPLGKTVGNALEVIESIETLKGNGPEDLVELTLELTGQMLITGGISSDGNEAIERARSAIVSGKAFEIFVRMVELHGGDTSVLENPSLLPSAPLAEPFKAKQTGVVHAIDADAVGRACLLLGAGRRKTTDKVDHAVGMSQVVQAGDSLSKGDTLAIIHARDSSSLEQAAQTLTDAFTISNEPFTRKPIVRKTISHA